MDYGFIPQVVFILVAAALVAIGYVKMKPKSNDTGAVRGGGGSSDGDGRQDRGTTNAE